MRHYKQDPREFDLDLTCPRCGHLVRAIPETPAIFHISEHSDQYAYLVARCPRRLCDVVLVIYDRLNEHVSHVFPLPHTEASSFHSSIPGEIKQDLAEAVRCIHAHAYRGTVVMARRAMQRIAVDKKAEGDDLKNQIDDLFKKGLVTKSLHDAAHEIRFFGNFGAHPRDDGLDDISREDARAVLALVQDFLTDLYVRPHETSELSKKRKGEA